jgi:hypothetical protein
MVHVKYNILQSDSVTPEPAGIENEGCDNLRIWTNNTIFGYIVHFNNLVS